MRIRAIKPDFFTDEELAVLHPLNRILFAALWCQADREGRLEDRPARIKAKALPYDDCDCDAMLGNLATAGFIIRYEVDGRKYIQIRTFAKNQRPNSREPKSEIPPQPTKRAHARENTRMHAHAQAEGEREGKGKGREGNTARQAEYARLYEQPEIRSLALFWCSTLEPEGTKPTIGLLRLVQKFFAGAYVANVGEDAIRAVRAAKDETTRDLYPPRCSARWAAEHKAEPGWVLRPGEVEKIAADYRRYGQPPTPSGTPIPTTALRPRALERDDVPMTPEDMAAIKADRERLFAEGKA